MNKEYLEPLEKGIKAASEVAKSVSKPGLGLIELGFTLMSRGTRFEVPMRRTIYFLKRMSQ